MCALGGDSVGIQQVLDLPGKGAGAASALPVLVWLLPGHSGVLPLSKTTIVR